MPDKVWTVDFYFDFVSPYAYFSWVDGRRRLAGYGVHVVPKPVVLAALLEQSGQLGPAEIPAKRTFMIHDTLRYAGRRGIEFTFPNPHPFNSITASRLALPEVSGSAQEQVIDTIWQAAWARGNDLSDRDQLVHVLCEAGFDGAALVEETTKPAVKLALRQQTEEAVARGVFGVPSFVVRDQLFWGNDRVDDLCELLAGDDPINRKHLDELAARPMGVKRVRRKQPE